MVRTFGNTNEALSLPEFLLSDDKEYTVLPGFCDVHVHFREPGFSYKETIKTGSLAAAHGGFTDVCTMPNLKPVPDSFDHLKAQLDIIERDACISVHPFAAITVGEEGLELSDMETMAPYCVGFSDDGKGIQSETVMYEAMETAAKLGKIVSAHCEINEPFPGVIHESEYSRNNGISPISSENEWKMVERDLIIARETGCAYHVCHISTKESVELIRKAKKSGQNVTCETAPHYLILDTDSLIDEGRFKMKPPLATPQDREVLINGLLDGTIDMIASDHAPHSQEEKSKGLAGSAFGIVGIETEFPLMYTHFVKTGIISMDKLMDLMVYTPRKRFHLLQQGYSVWDLNAKYEIDPGDFLSLGRSTPFEGVSVYGKNIFTSFNKKTVYRA